MLIALIQLVIGLALLTYGAERLVHGASSVAFKLGLSPLVIGLTVVAFGTSAPELVVSVGATIAGNSDIAIGNVVGSNIANIALILGLTAMIRPMTIHLRVLKVEIPIMILVTFFTSIFIIGDEITRFESAILFTGLIVFIVYSIRSARTIPVEAKALLIEEPEIDIDAPIWKSWVFIGLGLGLLVGGGDLLVRGAVEIATIAGISQAVIGITVVAIGTSLPELATSAVAAFKGESDIAVGNIIGSNIFNMLCILGLTGIIHPLDSSNFGLVDLGFMLALTIIILPLMRRGFELNRLEGGFLVLTYVGYTVWLLMNN
jgi:cation:H+ antiporter